VHFSLSCGRDMPSRIHSRTKAVTGKSVQESVRHFSFPVSFLVLEVTLVLFIICFGDRRNLLIN
jgi:hypothetical protein